MSKQEIEGPSDDVRYETYVAKFVHYEPDLRRFIRSLLPTWTDTDDVLQRTAIVIWKKFEMYDPETNFMKWACVIARFEALAYRRKMARDRLVFREDVMEMMAAEGIDEMPLRNPEREALEKCLGRMQEKQRQFILLAYTPGVKVKEMAAEAGSSGAAFYMRLKRLRHQLITCIEKTIKGGDLN
ncbi:sigma-70 family RNA polymerase sigma factor [bacterium]|nr:sigma-70 family RNA polymerase sigma factor [bacterium]